MNQDLEEIHRLIYQAQRDSRISFLLLVGAVALAVVALIWGGP